MGLLQHIFNFCHADDVTNAISAGVTGVKTSVFTVITDNMPTLWLIFGVFVVIGVVLWLVRRFTKK